jgi:hypothetical protein
VKRLGQLSFAEAEEFIRDVRRQHVLGQGKLTLKSVLKDLVSLWEERHKAVAGGQNANL